MSGWFRGNQKQRSHVILLQPHLNIFLSAASSSMSCLPRAVALPRKSREVTGLTAACHRLSFRSRKRSFTALHTRTLSSTSSSLLPRARPSFPNALLRRTAEQTRKLRSSISYLSARCNIAAPLGVPLIHTHTSCLCGFFFFLSPLSPQITAPPSGGGGPLAPPLLDDCGKFHQSATLGYLTVFALFPRGTPTANATVT